MEKRVYSRRFHAVYPVSSRCPH